MANLSDVFGPGANFDKKFIKKHEKLGEITEALKKLNLKVVLVLGTYDLLHIGHARYIEKAKQQGDVLIVAVDSDKWVQSRKGPRRPIVPEQERIETLAHLRHVDYVTIANEYYQDGLINTFKPDILVATERSYSPKQIKEIEKHGIKVVVLPSQAETSTSAKIRLMTLDFVEKAKKTLEALAELE